MRRISVLLTSVLWLCCGSLSAVSGEAPQVRIRRICRAFSDGAAESLRGEFSPELEKAYRSGSLSLSLLQLSTVFGKLIAAEGEPVRIASPEKSIAVYAQNLRFERGNLTALVSFDSAGKLCGFRVIPEQKKSFSVSSAPVSPREREVRIGKEEPFLSGTLTLPEGKPLHPVVILIHGSGPHDRDSTVFENKPFRDLAALLVRRNIAVLRYDKRSFAHPEWFRNRRSFTADDETVDDVLRAIEFLKTVPEIDAQRIWLLGHSFGGMLLPRIASRTKVPAGYIFMAAPASPLPDLLEEQGLFLLKQQTNRTEEERNSAVSALRRQTEILKHPTEKEIPGSQYAYWKDLSVYSQTAEAARMQRPLLFLQGGRDFQVSPRHLDLWKKALGESAERQYILYDSLNHLMLPGTGPAGMAEYAVNGRIPETVADDIAKFLFRMDSARKNRMETHSPNRKSGIQ